MNRRWHNLLVHKSNNLLIQLFRYTFVGGLAFAVDFGLLYLLTEYFGLHYILSATISFVAGLIVNYLISIRWVFISSTYNRRVEFILFTFIGIIGLGLNDLFLWFFTEKCHLYYMISKIVAAVAVYLWNFFARRYLLFNKTK